MRSGAWAGGVKGVQMEEQRIRNTMKAWNLSSGSITEYINLVE